MNETRIAITVDIKPEVQVELARQAADYVRAIEAHAARLLEASVHHVPVGASRMNQAQPENTILEIAQFSNQIPALPDEAFTRQSLYEQEQRSSPPNNEPSASGACVPKRVLCFTSQIFGEFWNASTRPLDKNGLGLTIDETNHIASVIERNVELLPESCDVYNRWRQVLNIHQFKVPRCMVQCSL